MVEIKWSNYKKFVLELGDSRNITQFPIFSSRRDKLLDVITKGSRVLDVGAGDKWIGNLLKKNNYQCEYFSMDNDNNIKHDYQSLENIQEKFDFITLFDVAEHLNSDQVIRTINKSFDLLEKNGKLIISIPNIYYLGNTYFTTFDHVQYYSYMDLYFFMRSAGFDGIKIMRLSNKVWQLSLKLPIYIIRHIIRILIIKSFPHSDYATDIIMIGKK